MFYSFHFCVSCGLIFLSLDSIYSNRRFLVEELVSKKSFALYLVTWVETTKHRLFRLKMFKFFEEKVVNAFLYIVIRGETLRKLSIKPKISVHNTEDNNELYIWLNIYARHLNLTSLETLPVKTFTVLEVAQSVPTIFAIFTFFHVYPLESFYKQLVYKQLYFILIKWLSISSTGRFFATLQISNW